MILHHKPERFNKIKQLLFGISGNMLTLSLKQMEKDKLVYKLDDKRYHLTDKAHKITEHIIQIKLIVESLSLTE